MSSVKKGPGRPARKPITEKSMFLGVTSEPSDPSYAVEFCITEPNKLVTLFHILNSYKCNVAYLVLEPNALRIVGRSVDLPPLPDSQLDELKKRQHMVSGTIDCYQVFQYYVAPTHVGVYKMLLSEDNILEFACAINASHNSVNITMSHDDPSNFEFTLKINRESREGTKTNFPITRIEPNFQLSDYFVPLATPLLSLTVGFDDFKKILTNISRVNKGNFEIYRVHGEPLQFKWRHAASLKPTIHSFNNSEIKLIDNSSERVNSFEVEIDDIKRYFVSKKIPVKTVKIEVLRDSCFVLSSDLEPLKIAVFTNQVLPR
jgi:hypothetical protein